MSISVVEYQDRIDTLLRSVPSELNPIITQLLESIIQMETRLDELEDSRINRDEVELALSRIETFHDSLEAIENKINLFESLNIGEDEIEEILSMKSQLLEMKDIMQNIRSKVPREI